MSKHLQAVPDVELSDHARILTERFYDWELRGRGWQVWNYAVDIEPPFRPVSFEPPVRADGCSALARTLTALEERAAKGFEGWEEPFANPAEPPDVLVRIPLQLSPMWCVTQQANPLTPAFLEKHRELMAFEIAAEGPQVRAQLSLSNGAGGDSSEDILAHALQAPPRSMMFLELGLAQEFLVPLPDDAAACARVLQTLSQLDKGETGLLQILFKPACEPWADEMLHAALGPHGTGLFTRQDDLVTPCRKKISAPLYAVAVRIMGAAPKAARARAIADCVMQALRPPVPMPANGLIALPRRDDALWSGMMARTSRRSGMILHRDELATLVPFAPPPPMARIATVNRSAWLKPLSISDRAGHCHIFGQNDSTATHILLEMILHDLNERHGVILIDPRGDLAELVLRRLPRHRLADVSLVGPQQAGVGIDVLEAPTGRERVVLQVDLANMLARLIPEWDQRLSLVFECALGVAWAQTGTPSLADLRRFVRDAALREQWLDQAAGTAADWRKDPPPMDDAVFAALARGLDGIIGCDAVEAILSGASPKLDFAELLEGRVLLAGLAAPHVGRAAAEGLAELLVAKLHQALACTRAERPPGFLTIRDADRMARGTLDALLAAAKKAGIGVILASSEATARPDVRIKIDCPAGTDRAQLRVNGSPFSIAPQLPPEAPDAAQRAHDAREVSARRYGASLAANAHHVPTIRRQIISPQEGLRRPAMLARYARLPPSR